MTVNRVVLSGYYGFGNAGDEAVLAGLARVIRSAAGANADSIEITALSIDPAATMRDHNIGAVHRYRPLALLRTIASCDLLASGGGSLLQDVTSKHSIYYYLGVVRAAQIMGKRTMIVAQGVGPLHYERSRKLTASVAGRCGAISVRDADSASVLRGLGIDRGKIEVTADPALILGADLAHEDQIEAQMGAAISIRPWPGSPPTFIADIARACAETIGAPTISSMMMSPADAPLHDEFFDAYNKQIGMAPAARHARIPISWQSLSALSAVAGIVIGMRLHALILAAAHCVPAVALAYDPKVAAFMESTGQSDAVYDIRDNDTSKLAKLIERVWREREERGRALSAQLPELRRLAMRNGELAMNLMS